MALIKIIVLEINLKLMSFKKKYPPEAVRKRAGKVMIPNKNIPNAANIGLAIDAERANAP